MQKIKTFLFQLIKFLWDMTEILLWWVFEKIKFIYFFPFRVLEKMCAAKYSLQSLALFIFFAPLVCMFFSIIIFLPVLWLLPDKSPLMLFGLAYYVSAFTGVWRKSSQLSMRGSMACKSATLLLALILANNLYYHGFVGLLPINRHLPHNKLAAAFLPSKNIEHNEILFANSDLENLSKDIWDWQKQAREMDADMLKSDNFIISNTMPLTLRGAANIVSQAYSIHSFDAGKNAGAGMIQDEGELFFSQSGHQYRFVPKLNFSSGPKEYLVYDLSEKDNEGNYTDCHACTAPVSVIQYHIEAGNPFIERVYGSIANLGAWGDSGSMYPVTFKDGGAGFAVLFGTVNQGVVSNWIDVFRVRENGIVSVPELHKYEQDAESGAQAGVKQHPQ